jgi:hypothetical protein
VARIPIKVQKSVSQHSLASEVSNTLQACGYWLRIDRVATRTQKPPTRPLAQRSDEAIQTSRDALWIASLRSQ